MSSPVDALAMALENFKSEVHVLWDEIGLDPGVRATSLSDVMAKVHELLQERIRQEKNVRDQTRRNIQTCASKIISLYKQLEQAESEAHEFVAEHTSTEVPLLKSHAALSEHMDEKTLEREELLNELWSVISDVISMESNLGESTGLIELFCECQSQSFTEIQANTFKNSPASFDAERLQEIPTTLEAMRQKRVEIKSLCDERSLALKALDVQVTALCDELGENKIAYRNAELLKHPELSLKRIEAHKTIETQLLSLRRIREANIHEMANKLRILWNQLETPEAHWTQFIRNNEGRSMEVIKACEAELHRLEAEKQARVRDLVLQLIQRIRVAWDALSVHQIERRLFEDKYDYTQQAFSDETLESHKNLARSLETMVELSRPIIAKIKDYQALTEAKASYDELTKNSDRLRDRKYNPIKEEKLRKRVETLPRVMAMLMKDLEEWKVQNNHQPLMYEGVDFLQALVEEKMREDEAAARKAEEKRAKSVSSMSLKPHLPPTTPAKTLSGSSAASHAASSSNATNSVAMTPSRPRANTSRALAPPAPATTGKPVGSRSRTVSADAGKLAPGNGSSVAPTIKENVSNK